MAQNSTEVAYSFGQFGSAFADLNANTITPPEELAIVAIQFLADTSLDVLTSKDSDVFPTIGAAAHDSGRYTRTVNQGDATTNKIIFDQENAGTGSIDDIKVGDEVYDGATGVLHGTVTILDPDGNNTKEIQISASADITNDETLSFLRPKEISSQGVGGLAIDSTQVFPKGLTIYGRWDSVSIAADDEDGGVICYFGK